MVIEAAYRERPLVVLAEDSADLRGFFASALEMVGYRVVPVETGRNLVETVRELLARGDELRLIITDVRMPAMGGVEAARLLREVGNRAPLIFMTAYGDAWTRRQAVELGAVLLDKPLRIGDLRAAVATVLAA